MKGTLLSASRQKGTRAETAVVDYLKASGFPYAERRALHGNTDKGDIAGIPGVVIEVKNCETTALAAWVDEARTEAANAGCDVFMVVHKRRRKSDPGEWYVTLPLSVAAELIR